MEIILRSIERLLRAIGVPLPLFGMDPPISDHFRFAATRISSTHLYIKEWLNGSPLPPLNMIFLVQGNRDARSYIDGGRRGFETITETYEKTYLTVDKSYRVLDFGCGCGRVLRHWRKVQNEHEIHGTDYNPDLVTWAQRTVPFAQIGKNELAPPTNYADNYFDLIYAFSIYTHWTEELQHAWMKEMRRILKPGGLLIFSTHGEFHAPFMPDEELAEFRAGKMVVTGDEVVGSNICASFNPYEWTKNILLQDMNLMNFYPRSARGNPWQDIWFVQKPM